MKRVLVIAALFVVGCATTRTPDFNPGGGTPPVETTQSAAVGGGAPLSYAVGEPRVVTLDSRAPLVTMRVMITHGSTSEATGKEGLANLVSDAITDGGYALGGRRVTKEELAEMTIPWGSGARPAAFTSARATTFFFAAPREVIGQYIRDVLLPMLTAPAFESKEIDRIKNETLSQITSLRSEDLEGLGLSALDQYVLAGTPYEHHTVGTETSVPTLTRDDVVGFYRDFYRPENIIVGLSTTDPEIVNQVREAVRAINRDVTTASPAVSIAKPAAFTGRQAVVIEEPNAPAASVHLGFPYELNRMHEDFWPLYVANVWLGTHRDSFGQLYQKIREERGYNYGDYSYVEYWTGRSQSLFQLFNQPREQQYFSIWLRPVQHQHAVHLAKAATYELDQMIRRGISPADVEAAKNKARVLYLNLAETVPRLISARVDDAFYGSRQGFLDSYLESINRVTPDQVNAAIRRHLSTANIKYLIVTSTPFVKATADALVSADPVFGKTWKDYDFTQAKLPDGTTVWQVPEAKLPTVQLDAAWAHYPLEISNVRVGHVKDMLAVGRMLR